MSDLQQKLKNLEVGDSFTFLTRFGQSDLACEVGSECVIELEQTDVFKFRVIREHSPEGPHEAVFLGSERLAKARTDDPRLRHEAAL